MRYAHVDDRETEATAERIGIAIAKALGGSEAASPGHAEMAGIVSWLPLAGAHNEGVGRRGRNRVTRT